MVRGVSARLLLTLSVVASAACGSTSTASVTSSPVSPPSDYYVAGWVPSGYSLITAADDKVSELHGAGYGSAGDQAGEGLSVSTPPTANLARLGLGDGSPTTTRGHRATLVALMDTGQVFGHAVWWEERPCFAIAVQVRDSIDVATLTHVAQDVRPVDATTWHRLTLETDVLARAGQVAPDMTRHQVQTGSVGGDQWTLTALVPAGYPLGPEDQRVACAELAFKDEHSDGNGSEHAVLRREASRTPDDRASDHGLTPAYALRAVRRETGSSA